MSFPSYTNFGFQTFCNISKSIKTFYLVFHVSAVIQIYINSLLYLKHW